MWLKKVWIVMIYYFQKLVGVVVFAKVQGPEGTTEIQKKRTLAAKLTDLWLLINQN